MRRRDVQHQPGGPGPSRAALWLPTLLVLLLLGGAVASWHYDAGPRWLGWGPDPSREPAAVEAPAGLDLSPVPALAGSTSARSAKEAGQPDVDAVRAVVRAGVRDKDLGKRVMVAVADLATGDPLVAVGPDRATPASTTKLLTAAAALETLGPGHTFTTSVVRSGPRRITLVGGGDPYLTYDAESGAGAYPVRTDLATLAARTADALRQAGVRKVRLDHDASLFSGPGASAGWEPDYVPDGVVSPIGALWVDRGTDPQGWGRVADPATHAAQAFAKALAAEGIVVKGAPRARTAPGSATPLAQVRSAPVDQIVEHVLDVSDNEAAEVLAHHVGLAVEGEGSFEAGASAVVDTLDGLGVPTDGLELHDGSGLSRQNLVPATTLLHLLSVSARAGHPELRAVLTGMPVSGFTGSLSQRFADGPDEGLGTVRAKTGTLTGVHGLAGTVTDRNGTTFAFVALADRVAPDKSLEARTAIDRLAGRLAACDCS